MFVVFCETEGTMRRANSAGMKILAVVLFLSGAVLVPDPTWTLGLIVIASVIACTTVVIDEIRDAKRELIEKLERTIKAM